MTEDASTDGGQLRADPAHPRGRCSELLAHLEDFNCE
jgi:hypothetical protein